MRRRYPKFLGKVVLADLTVPPQPESTKSEPNGIFAETYSVAWQLAFQCFSAERPKLLKIYADETGAMSGYTSYTSRNKAVFEKMYSDFSKFDSGCLNPGLNNFFCTVLLLFYDTFTMGVGSARLQHFSQMMPKLLK